MADEKKTVKETQEVTKLGKFVAFFKNLPQNIATPFKNMWHELKKVTWPTKQDLIKYTGIVILFMVFMGVVIGLLDMGSSRLVAAISSLKSTSADQVIISDVEDAANEAEQAVEGAAEEAQEAVEDAAEEEQEAVEGAAEEAQQAAEEAATEAAEGAQNEAGQEAEQAPAGN